MGETVEALRATYSAANSWNEWATGAVTAGVVIELIALLLFGKEMPRKEKIALALGSILVVVGVSGEWVYGGRASAAAAQLQQLSDQKVAGLQKTQAADHKIAAQAAADAASLGVNVQNLHDFVTTQETNNNAVIGELRRNTADLNAARRDAVAAAASAASDLGKVTALLNEEQKLHQQVLALTTPRQIDDAHFKALVDALKQFAKTPIDFGTTVDAEPIDLFVRISDAIAAAGWSVQACSGGNNVYTNARPRFPNICQKTARGVQIVISASDLPKLGPAAGALAAALVTAGIPSSAGAFPDKMSDGSPVPNNPAPPGAIHVIVGARL